MGLLVKTVGLLIRAALVVIALAALAATLFDLNEVLLQLGRGNTGVTTLAVAVAVAHAALCVVAGWAFLHGHRRMTIHPA